MIYIETPRMMIRDFLPEDAADLQEIFGDAETMENCEPAYDPEKTMNFLHTFCIGRRGAVAAVRKDSGKLIGYILLKEYEPQVYEMGWIFHRSCWRQGFAYEACKAVMDHAFRERNAHKIFAEAIDGVKSVGLMKKLGMKPEGVQRSQTRDNHGNWADLYVYGLLAGERQEMGFSGGDLSCRPMTEGDIATVTPRYIESYNGPNGDGWTWQTTYKRIHQVWSREDSLCLILERGGEPLGFAMGYFEQYDDIQAYDLVEILLWPAHQGQGLGTRFMGMIEEAVKARDGAMIQLQAVNDGMHAHFYGKLGYQSCSSLVFMAKWL